MSKFEMMKHNLTLAILMIAFLANGQFVKPGTSEGFYCDTVYIAMIDTATTHSLYLDLEGEFLGVPVAQVTTKNYFKMAQSDSALVVLPTAKRVQDSIVTFHYGLYRPLETSRDIQPYRNGFVSYRNGLELLASVPVNPDRVRSHLNEYYVRSLETMVYKYSTVSRSIAIEKLAHAHHQTGIDAVYFRESQVEAAINVPQKINTIYYPARIVKDKEFRYDFQHYEGHVVLADTYFTTDSKGKPSQYLAFYDDEGLVYCEFRDIPEGMMEPVFDRELMIEYNELYGQQSKEAAEKIRSEE